MAHFTPFSKNATNIMEVLVDAAKDRKIQPEEVDFELLSVQTLVKTLKHKDWTIIEEPIETLFDEKMLRSVLLEIRQEYTIRVKPYETNQELKDIQIDILANKAKNKVIAVFKEGSVFPDTINLAKELKKEIYRKKLRAGLLIKHFETDLNSTIIKLSKAVKPGIALAKDIRISIAQSPAILLPRNDEIISHYKNKQKISRNLIDTVDAGEMFFEYIKPKEGISGRRCDGKFAAAQKPKIMYKNYRPNEETVFTKESEDSVQYYAKKEGYFKEESGLISISQKIAIQSATFKNVGSIDAGGNKDISVNIAKRDHNDDSVGSGVVIDVKELTIEGTVGASAKVKANALSVGEQTHRRSELEAVDNAKIKLHRGRLKAKTAEIEILENGTVEADDIHVKKMLGGEIIGQRIVIEELVANTVVIASESIEVGTISGEHNVLMINPNKIETYHNKIELLKAEVKIKNSQQKSLAEEHSKKIAKHKEQIGRIKTFQKRVQASLKAGETPNKADVLRIKQYKLDALKLQQISDDIAQKEQFLETLKLQLEELYEADMHAKVINKGVYDGHTQVVFVDAKTGQNYSMIPQGHYERLFLKKVGDEKIISR